MRYRELGKTKVMVSEIGLGCEHLDGKDYSQVESTINAALDAGINIFDIFMPGDQIRQDLSKAFGSRRKDVYIQGHICSTDVEKQYDISRDLPTVKKYFENLLKLFGYIDFGMLFYMDSEVDYANVFESGIADYVQSLKKNGDIRHIGFSSHDAVIAKKVIETGLPEMMMFSINPAFDLVPPGKEVFNIWEEDLSSDAFRGMDPERASLYRICERNEVGITVMKTFGAGKLLSPEHTPFAQPMTPAQCISYALTRPAVASALLGCQTADEVKSAMTYFSATEDEKDYMGIISSYQNDFTGSCVYCNHCLPCPANINIAAVHKFLDIARLNEQNIPPSIQSHYTSLSAHGSDCVACGNCLKRCPFDVPVIDNMKHAVRLFER